MFNIRLTCRQAREVGVSPIKFLKYYKQAKGMCDSELARMLGATKVSIHRWLHDKSTPSDSTAKEIFGISESKLGDTVVNVEFSFKELSSLVFSTYLNEDKILDYMPDYMKTVFLNTCMIAVYGRKPSKVDLDDIAYWNRSSDLSEEEIEQVIRD